MKRIIALLIYIDIVQSDWIIIASLVELNKTRVIFIDIKQNNVD